MVEPEEAKNIALSFPETDEHPHFNRIAFRVKKRIFSTLSFEDKTLNLMFTPTEQFTFCRPGSDVIFPISNDWGRKGATTIDLNKANKKSVIAALKKPIG